MDINNFAFTGRVTQDATIKNLASGRKVLTVNVAVNTGYGDYKKTLFIKVQQWGDKGEKIVNYLTKGTLVGGTGELSRSEWSSNKDGKTFVDFVVDVMGIQLLGNKQDGNKETSSKSDYDESDMVF